MLNFLVAARRRRRSASVVGTRDQNIRAVGRRDHFRFRKWRGVGSGAFVVVTVIGFAAGGDGWSRLGSGGWRCRLRCRLRRLALGNCPNDQSSIGFESRPQSVGDDLLVQFEFAPVFGTKAFHRRLEPTFCPHLQRNSTEQPAWYPRACRSKRNKPLPTCQEIVLQCINEPRFVINSSVKLESYIDTK